MLTAPVKGQPLKKHGRSIKHVNVTQKSNIMNDRELETAGCKPKTNKPCNDG